MTNRTKALIALLIAALLWSSSATVPKLLFVYAPPFTVAFERFFLASLIMLPFVIRMRKPKHFVKTLLPLGIFNGINIIFYYAGLSLTNANSASILGPTVPIIVVVLSHFFIRESVSKQKLIGILVGLSGAACIVVIPLMTRGSFASGNIWGNLSIVTANCSWSLYIVYSRKILSKQNIPPILGTAMNIFITTIFTGVAALLFHQPLMTSALLIPRFVFILLYATVGITITTFFLFQWAIQHVSAATASSKEYVQLVFGIAINAIILHERLTGAYIFGALLVAIGVFMVTREHLTKKSVAVFNQSD